MPHLERRVHEGSSIAKRMTSRRRSRGSPRHRREGSDEAEGEDASEDAFEVAGNRNEAKPTLLGFFFFLSIKILQRDSIATSTSESLVLQSDEPV